MLEQQAYEPDDETEGNSITSVDLGDCEESVKRLLVQYVLRDHLSKHKKLILDWALDVAELWSELHEGDQTHEWFNLVELIADQQLEVDVTVAAPNIVRDGEDDQDNPDYPDDSAADGAGEEVEAAQLMGMLNFDDDAPDYTDNNDTME
jgi:hypothetical protein